MTKSSTGVDDVRRAFLDDNTSLASALRRVIALGSDLDSAELRDWASHEAHGYNSEVIPEYRKVGGIIMIDGFTFHGHIRGQRISVMDLPEFARDDISETFELPHSAAMLEDLVRRTRTDGKASVQFSLPGGAELAKIMTIQISDPTRAVERVYWDVSVSMIEGVLDQIRTTGVRIISEMKAVTPGNAVPSREAADQAVSVVVRGGRRHQINIVSPHASGEGATATVTQPAGESGWTKTQTIWTVIGVLVTVVGIGVAIWLG